MTVESIKKGSLKDFNEIQLDANEKASTPYYAGQSFQTCLTYLVPGGITKVAYTGSDAYETTPVTWAVK